MGKDFTLVRSFNISRRPDYTRLDTREVTKGEVTKGDHTQRFLSVTNQLFQSCPAVADFVFLSLYFKVFLCCDT